MGRQDGARPQVSGGLPATLTRLAWDRDEAPSPGSAADRLRDAGVEPYTWSNGAGERYDVHVHRYTKLLVCAAGSITFLIGSEATPIVLHPGEGFILPPETSHAAIVGPVGCTCVEGRR